MKRFLTDQSGATSIEYGLIGALIFLVIVSGVSLLGKNTGVMYNAIAGNVGGASSS